MAHRPIAVLLAGVTGSGKTTLAEALAAHGMLRHSVDEAAFRAHGRYGINYPETEYFEREAEAVRLVRGRVLRDLAAGRDVVLDHGLWTSSVRREWSEFVTAAGARPLLVHLPISFDDALQRLTIRNRRGDANALAVTAEALKDFFVRFEAPEACEHAVSYGQDPSELLKVVKQMH